MASLVDSPPSAIPFGRDRFTAPASGRPNKQPSLASLSYQNLYDLQPPRRGDGAAGNGRRPRWQTPQRPLIRMVGGRGKAIWSIGRKLSRVRIDGFAGARSAIDAGRSLAILTASTSESASTARPRRSTVSLSAERPERHPPCLIRLRRGWRRGARPGGGARVRSLPQGAERPAARIAGGPGPCVGRRRRSSLQSPATSFNRGDRWGRSRLHGDQCPATGRDLEANTRSLLSRALRPL